VIKFLASELPCVERSGCWVEGSGRASRKAKEECDERRWKRDGSDVEIAELE